MNQRRTRNLPLLMIAALLSLATPLVSADPNSRELTHAPTAVGNIGGADTKASHAPSQSNSATTVAFAASRSQSRSAIHSRQSASGPQDPRSAETEPRECDVLHGLVSSCIFN